MRRALLTVLVTLAVVLAGCGGGGGGDAIETNAPRNLDMGGGDGASGYGSGDAGTGGSGAGGSGAGGGAGGGGAAGGANTMTAAPNQASDEVGVSVGGAQDANAFRTNVEEGYVPQPTDVTHAGLFHDYYFDTNLSGECRGLFCPAYDRAVSRDPLSGEREEYLAVGLNSGITESDLQRQRLNLIVVLDTSGSMNEQFDQYYYDGNERHEVEDNGPKIDAAQDAVATLTRQLGPEDRFALVTYDDRATVRERMRSVGETDMRALRDRVHRIRAGGSTNLADGMATAADIADRYPGDEANRTTRIVYVTDAMPNEGDTSVHGLQSRIERQADRGIHTTFVGVGVDFNSRLTDALASTRGANYYSVHSPAAFRDRMAEGFTYMVTPLAFDLSLSVDAAGYRVENVYGAPNANGELLHVTSLFPSRSSGGGGEGSVMLVELERLPGATQRQVTLTASYDTPRGVHHERTRTITFHDRSAPYYESSGVRKAVALTRYATLMQNWAAHERALARGEDPEVPEGIESRSLGQWEQQSVPLTVSPPYDDRIDRFREYFRGEMRALDASRMQRDLRILRMLDELDR